MSIYISASSLKDYIQCSKRVDFRLNHPDLAVQTREMVLGSAMHLFLEKYWKYEKLAEEKIVKIGRDNNLDAVMLNSMRLFSDNFFRYFRGLLKDDDLIEYKFKVKYMDGVYLVGKMDRISSGSIYDWKTTAKPPKSISDDPQFIIYHLAYNMVFKEYPKFVGYASLSTGKMMPYVLNRAYYDEITNYIIPNMVRDIKAKNYSRDGIFRSKCYKCPYKIACLEDVNDELDSPKSFTRQN